MSQNPFTSKSIKKQTMAEQMAETIQEMIVRGELEGGATLPTEPELAEQFDVSRAVVRDATRILMARGLVEVQHGRGVFVTRPDNLALGEAILLALSRAGATVWDVEEFELAMLPEIAALAAANATEEEIQAIRRAFAENGAVFAEYQRKWFGKKAPPEEGQHLLIFYRKAMETLYAATHNKLVKLLARPLLHLRNLRTWQDAPDDTAESVTAFEASLVNNLVEAIASGKPDQARKAAATLYELLPPEAVDTMRKTPVGQIPDIPVTAPRRK